MRGRRLSLLALVLAAGCAPAAPGSPAPRIVLPSPREEAAPSAGARQLVVVTTSGWDSTSGVMRRYARSSANTSWREEGDLVPVVVGRAGLAWGADTLGTSRGDPRKREGDGRAPAGMFPLDTAFGFAPPGAARWIRLPYVTLGPGSECVDDGASVHYNTVVDRGAVPRVDWTSAERMREIEQYRFGVIVGYNARPVQRGRGSCIFLHIWGGPSSTTAGCTAFPERAIQSLLLWLDPARRPMLVQLPAAEYARLRARWDLP
jgi:D-alanyl-D-alanine dipeptidase